MNCTLHYIYNHVYLEPIHDPCFDCMFGHLLEGWIPKIEDFHRFQVYIHIYIYNIHIYRYNLGTYHEVPTEQEGFHRGFRAIVRVVVLRKAALFDEENLRFTYGMEHLNRFLYGYFCQDAELHLFIWQMTCNWELFVEDDWMKSKFFVRKDVKEQGCTYHCN